MFPTAQNYLTTLNASLPWAQRWLEHNILWSHLFTFKDLPTEGHDPMVFEAAMVYAKPNGDYEFIIDHSAQALVRVLDTRMNLELITFLDNQANRNNAPIPMDPSNSVPVDPAYVAFMHPAEALVIVKTLGFHPTNLIFSADIPRNTRYYVPRVDREKACLTVRFWAVDLGDGSMVKLEATAQLSHDLGKIQVYKKVRPPSIMEL